MSDINPDLEAITREIREYIQGERRPSTKIKGEVVELNPLQNTLHLVLKKNYDFYPGALVLLDEDFATVMDYYGPHLILNYKKIHKLKLNQKVLVDTNLINLILEKLERTIDKIEENQLNEDNKRILKFLINKGQPQYNTAHLDYMAPHLNQKQHDAVKKSLKAKDFHLIIGPPGTGKTTVIREIIQTKVQGGDRVLVTAWTNSSVDNILEKLNLDGEKILRLGSLSEISRPVRHLALQEQRKHHPQWSQVREWDEKIKNTFLAIKEQVSEDKKIQKQINILRSQIFNFRNILYRLKHEKKELIPAKTTLLYKNDSNSDNLIIEKEMGLKKKKAEEYLELAGNIYELGELEAELPDNDTFYALEKELKELKSKKILKKVSSIFNSSKYQEFEIEIQKKDKAYQEMVNTFQGYWEAHDLLEAELEQLYPQGEGDLIGDAIKSQLDILKSQESFLDLKKVEIESETARITDKVIFEAYDHYYQALDKKMVLINTEINQLNLAINLKKNKRAKIKDDLEGLKSNLDKLKADKQNLIMDIEKEVFFGVKVVASTVISSSHRLMEHDNFDCMIMDEASQVASFMSLLPLIKCGHFILVGDDKQLQPIEESRLSPALNQSIFNRLLDYYPESATFLNTQYRMHQDIANLSSELFYKGKLLTGSTVSELKLMDNLSSSEGDNLPEAKYSKIRKFPSSAYGNDNKDKNNGLLLDFESLAQFNNQDLLNLASPLTYIDTSKLDYFEDETGSGCVNTAESKLVVYLVEKFLKNGLSAEDMGIITPYQRQKQKIKEILNNELVEVDTVYRFQGREKEVIILSFCKSGLGKLNPYTKKFMAQKPQLNVALTRAKRKLMVVGNSTTLKKAGDLRKLLKLIGEDNTIILEK